MRGDNYVIKDVNNLSGLDKLRIRAAGHERRGQMDAANALYDIADQIAREHAEDCFKMGLDYGTVSRVITDMERHVSGVEGMEDSPVARWARELREALGGDGRDPAADVSVSAYDLLPEEDREAIAWVRERGGLDAVKERWSGRVALTHVHNMAERHKAKVARMQRHIEHVQGVCKTRAHRIVELNKQIAEMRPRLMPEGMEWLIESWPRFEDGEPVNFGDVALIDGEADMVEAVQLWIHGKPVIYGDGGSQQLDKGERVKRSEPKVLDADGVEIRAGDTVYEIETGEQMWVCALPEQGGYQCVKLRLINGMFKTLDPCRFTHRAPVLAADGRPLREGETVWLNERGFKSKIVHRGEPLQVVAFDKNGSVGVLDRDGIALGGTSPWWFNPSCLTHERPVLDADGKPLREGETVWSVKTGERYVVGAFAGGCVNVSDGRGGGLQLLPSQLTHERPDSWERWRKEWQWPPVKYCELILGVEYDHDTQLNEAFDAQVDDLVRRAKKLAERGA